MLPSSIPIPLPGGLHRPLPKFISVAQKFSTEVLADIDAAIDTASAAAFSNQGQICLFECEPTRISIIFVIVHSQPRGA